ncbi:DNA methyltransferase [Chlorogloeopsis fritschii PCC 6912]|uniref:site-specific DNA-methyltransferase (adenine-specific) n=1 Tax=Chlorogloeopsis fritschii PCC 6912 TaxID=211165 RepID=A0A433N6D1_CHLFR|nr:DNA adenine methylase [Chlorogloeopsis fritschii]RUR77058.1 DNA methyltransferase [Chlorogloeopsis fritschii PCC 6912]
MSNPPLLRYFGGKHRDARKIIRHFPQHQVYCEVFGGGASVLLQKQPSQIEIYNDLSGDVVNFFRVLRDRTEELVRAIELTPYSREEYNLAFNSSDDCLESARRLYIRSWQSYGSGCSVAKKSGWRFLYRQTTSEDVVGCFNRTSHLWDLAGRLKHCQIENDDAIAVINRYGRNPNCLIYCDPPYVHSSRTEDSNYDFEMTDQQHKELADILHSVNAMCIVSGYACELYSQLYKDWRLIQWETLVNGVKRKAVESLWVSPSCDKHQLPLLGLLA